MDGFIFKTLMLIISICLIVCTIGLLKALNSQEINGNKIDYMYDVLSNIDGTCFITNEKIGN